jgi:competence protein ComEA
VIDRRKAEVAGYAVAAFVLVLLALRLLHHGGGGASGAPVSLSEPSSDGAARSRNGSQRNPGVARLLVVDVAGEVRRPGVYRVPAGSRVDTAVQQAGGFTRRGESAAVNLAMPLHDGQQVIVPRRGSLPMPGASATGAMGGTPTPGAPPAQPISLSSATVEQLDTLDGIGPTLAGRIVAYRAAHGGFRSIDELRQVDGIGDKRFESLRKAVTP